MATYSEATRAIIVRYTSTFFRDRDEIGRWDIENQRPMDFELTRDLRKALIAAGYMKETTQ